MDRTPARIARRFALAGCLALVATFLPLPSFVTEVVSAVERVDVPDLRAATDEELAQLDGAAEEGVGEADRLVGTVEGVEDFRMLGVVFDDVPTEPTLARVRDAGGNWGEWFELELELDKGPDAASAEAAGAKAGTEPFWVDSADGFQVSVGAGDAAGSDVLVVRERERTVVAEAAEAGAAAVPLSGLHLRSEWGARPPKEPPSYASTVKLAVVHHSVSSNSYSPSQVPAQLRSIQAFHMDGRGWNDIAYNFVVDRYGGMWEGRGGGVTNAVIGAHASGFNTASVGVMVLGDYTGLQPTAASIESVSQVIGWKLSQYGADPSGRVDFVSGGSNTIPAGQTVNLPRVVGHRDVGATSCPGTVYQHLGTVRSRGSAFYGFYRTLSTPDGVLESATGGSATVTVKGWAIDRTSSGPATVRVSAGPVASTLYTSLPRPELVATYGGNGSAGFAGTLSGVPPGMQPVCATVWSGLGRANDLRLGCRWVLVGDPTGKSPVGRFGAASTSAGRVHVSGWALDPESASPLTTELLVDGVVKWAGPASRTTSVPSTYTSLGTSHGFVASAVAIPAGSHVVCVRARNVAAGVDTLVDCATVNVPAHSPGGTLDRVGSNRPGKVDITGWALDMESTQPINVLLVVAGRWTVVSADRRRDDIALAYPGYGPNHGFAASVSSPGGPQNVCAYGINVHGGSNKLLGCRRVDVVK